MLVNGLSFGLIPSSHIHRYYSRSVARAFLLDLIYQRITQRQNDTSDSRFQGMYPLLITPQIQGRTLPVVSRNLYKEDVLGLLPTIFIPFVPLQFLIYHVRSSRNPTDRIRSRHDLPERESASSYKRANADDQCVNAVGDALSGLPGSYDSSLRLRRSQLTFRH